MRLPLKMAGKGPRAVPGTERVLSKVRPSALRPEEAQHSTFLTSQVMLVLGHMVSPALEDP